MDKIIFEHVKSYIRDCIEKAESSQLKPLKNNVMHSAGMLLSKCGRPSKYLSSGC
jgi:hypothetical protein